MKKKFKLNCQTNAKAKAKANAKTKAKAKAGAKPQSPTVAKPNGNGRQSGIALAAVQAMTYLRRPENKPKKKMVNPTTASAAVKGDPIPARDARTKEGPARI